MFFFEFPYDNAVQIGAPKTNSHTAAPKKPPESAPVTARASHSTAASNDHPPAAAAKKPASAAPAAAANKKEPEKKEKEEKPKEKPAAGHPPASARDRPRTASGKTVAAGDKAGAGAGKGYDASFCFARLHLPMYSTMNDTVCQLRTSSHLTTGVLCLCVCAFGLNVILCMLF